MAKTVIGLFDEIVDAHDTIADLVESGIPRDDISLIVHNRNGLYSRNPGDETESTLSEYADEDAEGALKGAGVGAAVGGIAGILLGLGALVVPGIGPVIAVGPLVAALGGAGIGAVTGGMVGALVDAGVPDEDAQVFIEGVRRGSILVAVNAGGVTADRAAEIINRHHPVDLGQRAVEYRNSNWQGFNADAEPFAFDQTQESFKQRAPQSELDYGPGARTYLAGKPVNSYDRSKTDMANYRGDRMDNWHMYESRFRQDFANKYANKGVRWEDYRLAYRFGFDRAQMKEYSNTTWERVRDYLRQDWERENLGRDWLTYEEAIRNGWEVGHVPH